MTESIRHKAIKYYCNSFRTCIYIPGKRIFIESKLLSRPVDIKKAMSLFYVLHPGGSLEAFIAFSYLSFKTNSSTLVSHNDLTYLF